MTNAINAVKIDIINPQAKANNTAEQPARVMQTQPQQAYVNTSPGVMKVGDIPVSNEKMPAQYVIPKLGKKGEAPIMAKQAPKASALGYSTTPSYGPYASVPDPYLAPYFQDNTMFNPTSPYLDSYPAANGPSNMQLPYFYPPLPGHYPGDIYV